jgi:hypothetical protein
MPGEQGRRSMANNLEAQLDAVALELARAPAQPGGGTINDFLLKVHRKGSGLVFEHKGQPFRMSMKVDNFKLIDLDEWYAGHPTKFARPTIGLLYRADVEWSAAGTNGKLSDVALGDPNERSRALTGLGNGAEAQVLNRLLFRIERALGALYQDDPNAPVKENEQTEARHNVVNAF